MTIFLNGGSEVREGHCGARRTQVETGSLVAGERRGRRGDKMLAYILSKETGYVSAIKEMEK